MLDPRMALKAITDIFRQLIINIDHNLSHTAAAVDQDLTWV